MIVRRREDQRRRKAAEAKSRRRATTALESLPRPAADLSHLSPEERRELAFRLQEPIDPDLQDVATILGIRRAKDAERMAALDRLLRRMNNPVHRKRWPAVREALAPVARERRTTPEALLLEQAGGALWEAIEEVLPYTAGELHRMALPKVRATLNNLLTANVLGPEWRRRYARREGEERREVLLASTEIACAQQRQLVDDAEALMAAAVRRAAAERAFERAPLTKRERELVDLMLNGDEDGDEISLAEAARQLGISAGTARALWSRVRRKLTS